MIWCLLITLLFDRATELSETNVNFVCKYYFSGRENERKILRSQVLFL